MEIKSSGCQKNGVHLHLNFKVFKTNKQAVGQDPGGNVSWMISWEQRVSDIVGMLSDSHLEKKTSQTQIRSSRSQETHLKRGGQNQFSRRQTWAITGTQTMTRWRSMTVDGYVRWGNTSDLSVKTLVCVWRGAGGGCTIFELWERENAGCKIKHQLQLFSRAACCSILQVINACSPESASGRHRFTADVILLIIAINSSLVKKN